MVNITSKKDLKEFTMAQLVETFNGLPITTDVKKFSDRKTAERRVWAALEENEAAAPPVTTQTSRGCTFSYPAEKLIKPHRLNTKRARVIEMLTAHRGATIEEVMEDLGWDKRTAAEGIRLLHNQLGYGLQQDIHCKIRAFKA